MGKRSIFIRRIAVFLLAFVLAAAFLPAGVRAQEETGDNTSGQSEENQGCESDESSEDDEEAARIGGESGDENGGENGDENGSGNENDGSEEDDGNSIQDTEPSGQEEDVTQTEEESFTAVASPVDSGDEYYDSYAQFLSLSSDRFAIYQVVFVSDTTQKPGQPASPVTVALNVPADYDAGRLVVSQIVLNGTTPTRTELAFTYENGQAKFEAVQEGIYAVMEKKVQIQLPSSLEPTAKVEKLELNKKYSSFKPVSKLSATAKAGVSAANPKTGDDNSVLLWGIITGAAAVVAVIAVVLLIIIRKRRK